MLDYNREKWGNVDMHQTIYTLTDKHHSCSSCSFWSTESVIVWSGMAGSLCEATFLEQALEGLKCYSFLS